LELQKLNADIRTKTGNSPARALRRDGKVPAVLYGPGVEPILLSVRESDFETALKNSTAAMPLFNLVIAGGEEISRMAMVKELQSHPLTTNPLHVDFYEISMDRKINVMVPVIAEGISKGVVLGGMMQLVRRELEVACLPLETPDSIVIDITDLDIGDSIHVEDIQLEGDIEIIHDVNFTVATVLSATKEEVEEVEDEEGEEGEEGVEGEEGEGESADES
jgi:large subunit ribosomal protein L25